MVAVVEDERTSLIHPPINAVVHGNHNDSGNPEADRTRDDCVRLIHYEHTTLGILRDPLQMVLGRVPAEEDGREGDESGQKPHIGQHKAHRSHRHIQGILEGPNYCVVPGDQMKAVN